MSILLQFNVNDPYEWEGYIENTKSLNLSKKKLTDSSILKLADVLKCNTTLRHIDLSYNNITELGAQAIAEALKHNSTLRQLNLSHNNITRVGAQAIAEAIRENNSIATQPEEIGAINLCNNMIGEEGINAIFSACAETNRYKYSILLFDRINECLVDEACSSEKIIEMEKRSAAWDPVNSPVSFNRALFLHYFKKA